MRLPARRRRRAGETALAALPVLAAPAFVCAGCGGGPAPGATGSTVQVVAAENVWGAIASQLGGARVHVTSIVTDPNEDPHDHESSAGDARAFAIAQYVIVNGAGYDTWASTLLNASGSGPRVVFTVAQVAGLREGDNPHFWYSPTDVERVADRITNDLSGIDRRDAGYFTQQRVAFETSLQPYHQRIAAIERRYAGRRVAATESIFTYLADALGLDLISPPEFMKAVAEGNDPPADTVTTFQTQLQTRAATVLVYNQQTATDVTNNLRQLAADRGIPVVGLTETMPPPYTTFGPWMAGELDALQNALGAAGRDG